MVDYDVILGMDWFSRYNATIFYKMKKVVLQPSEEEAFEYKGTPRGRMWPVITTMNASRMLAKGCVGYLANIMDTTKKRKTVMSNIVVVCQFLDVFLKDLPRLPPDRKIEFEIELLPKAASISKVPYRIAPAELKELKQQLQELLHKGFIRPNYSP